MEDRHITEGKWSVPARSLTVPPTLTDAVPSGPPRYARHDDMRMPDRLLRFDEVTSTQLSGRFATPFASMTKNMKIFTPSTLSPQHRARHRVRDGWNSGGWD